MFLLPVAHGTSPAELSGSVSHILINVASDLCLHGLAFFKIEEFAIVENDAQV